MSEGGLEVKLPLILHKWNSLFYYGTSTPCSGPDSQQGSQYGYCTPLGSFREATEHSSRDGEVSVFRSHVMQWQ